MYCKLSDLASGIAGKIRELDLFRAVAVAQASDGGQLLEEIEFFGPPVAVVAIGSVSYDDKAVSRTIRPIIVVTDVFRRGSEARSGGIWDKMEAVSELFLPQDVPSGLDYPEILGIEFCVADIAPLSSEDNSYSAYMITLEGTEDLKNEAE